jgi:hypothetical protein
MGDPSPDSEPGYDYQNDQTSVAGEREKRHYGYNGIAPERGCKTGIHGWKLIVTRPQRTTGLCVCKCRRQGKMKTLLTFAVATGMMISIGSAQEIRERQKEQQERIAQGVASGQLTPEESVKLEKKEARIKARGAQRSQERRSSKCQRARQNRERSESGERPNLPGETRRTEAAEVNNAGSFLGGLELVSPCIKRC